MTNSITAIKASPRDSLSQIQLDPLTILVVNDSAIERRLLSAILSRFGHHLIQASSGAEAVKHTLDHSDNIDLILMDVNLPELDGYQTANKIRTLETSNGIEWQPIIFLSGKNSPNDIAMGIESGGDDFISKPVNSLTLQAKIHAMSRISKMRKRLIDTQQKLEKQAHYDELTGIANRRLFLSLLDKEIARSHRHSLPLSLAFFDIDKFKQVNDTYGHQVGDVVLKSIAKMISENLRREDTFGRLGGEEFCILLPGQKLTTAKQIIERHSLLIENTKHRSNSDDFTITASFGISELSKQDSVNSLLEKADQLLFLAKKNGRNRIEV